MSGYPTPALEGTHHLIDSQPAYSERFDEVLAFHPPGLAPARRGDSAWHIHPDGSAAYTRRFRRAFGFYDDLAAVISEDGWHHISPDGQDAYTHRYDWCGNFQNGLCSTRDRHGTYFHITKTGARAYGQEWRYAGDFREGISVVQSADGWSTHIHSDGRLVHGRRFLDLDVFHKGFARARDEDGWTHINLRGRPAYLRRFSAVEPFYNGQARIERFDGGLEIIGEDGTTIVELRSALRSEFAELSADLVGFWRTQTVATAVELGVFEQLPAASSHIANKCGLDTQLTARLLNALGEMRLVAQKDHTWRTTTKGRYLARGDALTLADAALEYAGPLSDAWTALPQALRKESGWRPPDIFGDVAKNADRLLPHHRMLRSYARHDYGLVSAALNLKGTEHVIDAGGGFGTLGEFLLAADPKLSVTVLDHPQIVSEAASQALNGLTWKAADLFSPWGILGDAVIMARVLHDWDNAKASQILQHARSALKKDGLLFLIEMLLPDTGFSGALCDLHLLAVTGGQERSERSYRKLLEKNGFTLKEVRRIPALPSILVGIAK